MNIFNSGVVAGAYWSVIGPGKNLQLAPQTNAYYFRWDGDVQSGGMSFFSQSLHPGRLPEPVTLVGPEDGAVVDVNGIVLSCEVSENAIGYQLLFGCEPYRMMDYMIVSDTPEPPSEVIITFPFEQTFWSVRVYDEYGSTIYADPICIYPENVEDSSETLVPDVNVSISDNSEQIELEQGQILVVTLESNPSTGYSWELIEDPNSILEQVGDVEFKPVEQTDPPMVGAGGWEIFRFKAVSTGQMTLNLVYRRSWETDAEPANTFSIDVVVN